VGRSILNVLFGKLHFSILKAATPMLFGIACATMVVAPTRAQSAPLMLSVPPPEILPVPPGTMAGKQAYESPLTAQSAEKAFVCCD
jgi:hypothetical protein